MALTRRDMLGMAGGATAGWGLSQLPFRRLLQLDDQVLQVSNPGIQRWVRTTCQICPGACGMEVRLVDGRPVGVRGNALNPISRGGLCPVGTSALHLLHSPDRYKAPMTRVGGSRSDGSWSRIGWDAAIDGLGDRISALVGNGKAANICMLDGHGRGLLSGLARQFMSTLGSDGYFAERSASPVPTALDLTQGIHAQPAYDLENAQTILSFGAPLLEGWISPVQGHRAVGGVRRARSGGDLREFIHLDVRRGKTARLANRFVQVEPGGMGAVALSVAHVLISQQIYDSEFVEANTFGFEDWTDSDGTQHKGFRTFVMESCRPQDLEAVSGVPTRTVLEIAKRFAEHRPAVALSDTSALAHNNGVQSAMAVQALNALVGSIEQPGGVLSTDPPPLAAVFGDSPDPAVADATPDNPFGRRDIETLLEQVQGGERKVDILFLLHSNPLFSAPSGERFAKLFGEDTYVVSLSPIPDASSQAADLILPDHTFLERWQDGVGPATFPNAFAGLTRPITQPLFDTRHTGDVLLDIALRAAPEKREMLPWSSFEELLRDACKGLFEARRGSPLTSEREAVEIREMERRGWWIPAHESFDEFWDDIVDSGGWWDPAYPYGVRGRAMQTPDQRFDFSSRRLSQALSDVAAASGIGQQPAWIDPGIPAALACLPHSAELQWSGEAGEDSLALHVFRPIVPNTAVSANMPWVREILHEHVAWETWADLHEQDAERLGIKSHDLIECRAGDAAFTARAVVGTSVAPGVVAVPYGLGRTAGGRWASNRGSNPNQVISPDRGALSGRLLQQGTRVSIQKLEGRSQHA